MNAGQTIFFITVTAIENKKLRFCMTNTVLALNVNPRGIHRHKVSE